ncbi:MAG: ATP-binding cassette domain-containing protein [Nitrospinae bacterium]|nr:ATP-binding cassette domain-containing protein [Nitrospinota bacterium]
MDTKVKNKSTFKGMYDDYRRLLKYLRPYRGEFLFASLTMVIVSSTSGGAAFLIQPLMDNVFIKKDARMLTILPGILVAIYILRGAGRYFSSITMQRIGMQTVRDLKNEMYGHTQGLSLRFFQQHTTGRLISRIFSDTNLVQESISVVIYDTFREGLTVVTLVGVLIYRDPTLSVFALLVLPFSALFIGRLGSKIKKITFGAQERAADLISLMSEAFSGVRVVKAFGMEAYETEKFKGENERIFNITVKTVKINELSSPLLEFIGALAIAAIIYYGGWQVVEGRTTMGSFFSFLTALFMLFPPISKLARVWTKIQQAMAAATRIFEVLDQKPDVADQKDTVNIGPVVREVAFEDVVFAYGNEPVLRGINFTSKAGTITAIVGMSGAGKTTMVDLIPRFYDPLKGRVLFDGVDIRTVTLESLRAQIGIVTQDVFLFNDTIWNNIAYGRSNVKKEEVEAAAKAAYAHNFIMGFPDGYQTIIGERGARLSGGQKQRISIARALLKNPAVLILDEATSALDTESEIEVQKALNNLIENRTSFVIAHRLSTILHAQVILVMEKGKIVEVGTHNALMVLDGAYKKVFDLQFAANSKIG